MLPTCPKRFVKSRVMTCPLDAQIYGQGEVPMTITTLSKQDIADRKHPRWAERLGSAGRAYACAEVMVADGDDRALPCGEAGEV